MQGGFGQGQMPGRGQGQGQNGAGQAQEGVAQNGSPPQMQNGQQAGTPPGNGAQGGNRPSMNGSELDTSDGKIDMTVLITSSITFILLILALIFTFRFKRRK